MKWLAPLLALLLSVSGQAEAIKYDKDHTYLICGTDAKPNTYVINLDQRTAMGLVVQPPTGATTSQGGHGSGYKSLASGAFDITARTKDHIVGWSVTELNNEDGSVSVPSFILFVKEMGAADTTLKQLFIDESNGEVYQEAWQVISRTENGFGEMVNPSRVIRTGDCRSADIAEYTKTLKLMGFL